MKIDLQKQFEDYNTKYFSCRLHDVIVRWSKGKELTLNKEVLCGYCHSPTDLFKPNQIVISRKMKYSTWMWKLILLHEMTHLDLYLSDKVDINGKEIDHHGPSFNKAMLGLAKKGAFNDIW